MASQARASVSIRVALPLSTQAIVSNTQSVRILLRNAGVPDQTATVNTGGATTVSFSDLPPGGGYTLYAAGYSGLNGTGTMLSWGKLPVTLASGRNQLSLSLSVVVKEGGGADDLVTGPAGNGAVQLGAQKLFTSMTDFQTPGASTSNVEVFYPGQNSYLSKFGTLGNLSGQFGSHIQMLAIDSKDCVWVSDDTHHRVQKFDRDGNFILGIGSGQLWTVPGAVPAPAINATNYGFSAPAGVVVDAADNVYVADLNNHRVLKYDANGNFLMGFGYNTPWVAPAAAPAVPAHLNANGHFIPYGLDLDRYGNIYIGGYPDHRAYVFSPSGQFIRGIGQGTTWVSGQAPPAAFTPGTNAREFTSCWHVRVDRDGVMYATDGTDRVQVFDPNGGFLRSFSTKAADKTSGTAGYFDIGPDDNLYVAGYGTTAPVFFQMFTKNGAYLGRFGRFGTGDGEYNNPEGIAWLSDGSFYTVDRNNSRLQRLKGMNFTDVSGGLRLVGHRQPDTPVYAASGTYITPAVDAGSSVTWGSAFWEVPSLPGGTQVVVDAATSADGVTWSAWQLVTGTSVQGKNTASLAALTSRFLKLRLSLSTGNTALSPEIQEIGVRY
ncbi:NHL repeat-containing protein [bacterium]|nr:NHL repeat-containing protein [bacterium]